MGLTATVYSVYDFFSQTLKCKECFKSDLSNTIPKYVMIIAWKDVIMSVKNAIETVVCKFTAELNPLARIDQVPRTCEEN